ncbi:uncharacterized protein LOC111696210 [Eurytemora carolleeae]|uniref:uncharacterized protein LOC111696210 n=1 Tax=Eurytemora carolleeae TaxID=1294199 RepID=UPI000C787B88|nr:uncharacterized protein LOC111696210 [Eurytemora carolleeae]|eukprot:XP_023321526.1 uncharacterized protein LOC111696210 [Eurytemora affinis]
MRHAVSPTSPLSISDYDDEEIQLDFDKIYEAEIWNGKLKNRDKNPLLSEGSMETTKAQRKQENIALPGEATSPGIPDKDDIFPELLCDALEMEFKSEETSKEILNNFLIDVGSVSGNIRIYQDLFNT